MAARDDLKAGSDTEFKDSCTSLVHRRDGAKSEKKNRLNGKSKIEKQRMSSSDTSQSVDACESFVSDRSFDPDSAPGQDKSYDASILFFESDDEMDNSKDSDVSERSPESVRGNALEGCQHSKENIHSPKTHVLQTISAQVAEKAISTIQNVASKELLRLRSEIEKLTRKNLKLRHALHESEEKLSKSLTFVSRSYFSASVPRQIRIQYIYLSKGTGSNRVRQHLRPAKGP